VIEKHLRNLKGHVLRLDIHIVGNKKIIAAVQKYR